MIWEKFLVLLWQYFYYMMTHSESKFILENRSFQFILEDGSFQKNSTIYAFVLMVILVIYASDSFNFFQPIEEVREWKGKISVLKVVIFSATIFSMHTFYRMLVEIVGKFLGAAESVYAVNVLGSFINPLAIMIYAFAVTTVSFRRNAFQALMLGLVIFVAPSVMLFQYLSNYFNAIYATGCLIALSGCGIYFFNQKKHCSTYVACFVMEVVYFIAKYFMIYYYPVKLILSADISGRIMEYLSYIQVDLIFALIILFVLFGYKIATTANMNIKKDSVILIIFTVVTIVSIFFGTGNKPQSYYNNQMVLKETRRNEKVVQIDKLSDEKNNFLYRYIVN